MLLQQLVCEFVLALVCSGGRIGSGFTGSSGYGSCCFLGFSDQFDRGGSHKHSIQLTLVSLFLDLEIRLTLDISTVLPAGLVEFDAHVLIRFALNFADESDDAFLVWDFFGVDHDLLADLELGRHSNIFIS